MGQRNIHVFLCDYQTTAPRNLTTHKKSIHDGIKYTCTICGFQATRPSHLSTHISTKHKEKRYSCKYCNKEYKNQQSLDYHTKFFHEGVRSNCNICDHIAVSKSNLTVQNQNISKKNFHAKYVNIKEN